MRPDLASGWSADSAGRKWTFVLKDGVHQADGSALTAASLLASWRARWPEVRSLGVDSAYLLDERKLVVDLRDLPDDFLKLFAEPALSAIPVRSAHASTAGRLTPRHSGSPVVEFTVSAGGDLRDALEAGADLVVTREPAVIEYAAQRPELESFPLPWDRSYVLVQRPGAEPLQANLLDQSIRRSLTEAVRADARPTGRPFWWNNPCSTEISMHVTIPTGPRVVYLRTDSVARQLAERIVALASDSVRLRSLGLDVLEFGAAREKGTERAYVVSVPLRPIMLCREATHLSREGHIYPLVDTRARAIVRRGSPPLTVDWDGIVRLAQDPDELPGGQP